MNDKNNSARQGAEKEDSDLELQELLRKYLPEFADTDSSARSVKKAAAEPVSHADEVELADEPVAAPVAAPQVTPADEVEEMAEKSAPKRGLFSRMRRGKKNAPEAPDGALFDQLAAERNGDAVELDDSDMKIADEASRLLLSLDPDAADRSAAADESDVDETGADEFDADEFDVDADVDTKEFPAAPAAAADEAAAAADEADEAEESAAAESAVEESAAAESAAAAEPTTEEVDATEQNLFVGWGMDDALDRRAGAGTADKLSARNAAEAEEFAEQQRRALEYEYTERQQTPKIAAAYKYALSSLKIKVLIGAVLTVVLFFYENLALFGVQFAGVLDPAVYPVVYIMMSLQLMLLCCAAAYEQIFTGLRNLLTGRPTPESVTAVMAVFGIVYSSVAAALSVPGIEPVMYNFAVSACVLMTLIFAYLNTRREVYSFNIVSSKKPKYVLSRIPAAQASPESEAFGAIGGDEPDVLQIGHAGFVDGYFGRTSAVLHSTRVYVTAMLSVVTAAAILLAVFALVGGSDALDAISVAYIAVLGALPLSMFFTYSYPFFKANEEAYEMDATIVGEGSLEEYAGAAIISFDDKNVFPSYGVKVQNIKIEPECRIDRVLYYAASVFSVAGGPLGDVFDVATIEMGHSSDVQILSAGVGYLEARVDGENITFGRSAVLSELGIEIPTEVVEEDAYIEGDLSILYMVRDGVYIAKMYIKYIMDADFEFIVRQFANNGTCVCVKTLDPNIDEEMILSKVKGKRYPLRVVKLHDGDAERERADSGIVSRGTTKSLLQVVSLCDTVLSVKKTNRVIGALSAIVTLAILFVVMTSGSVGTIGSWLIVANQLFWMIPAALTAKLYMK